MTNGPRVSGSEVSVWDGGEIRWVATGLAGGTPKNLIFMCLALDLRD